MLEYGSLRQWRGNEETEDVIYTAGKEYIENALLVLEKAGLDFEVNFNLPDELTYEQAKKLWEFEGWKSPRKGGENK